MKRGQLTPFDIGIYLFMQMCADWQTGIYTGCALTIAFGYGDPQLKERVQKSLRRMRDRGYINYTKGRGERGSYPILLNKYEVRQGELLGPRLNAWKHGELVVPEYEAQNGGGRVKELPGNGEGTVAAPIQEVQEVQESKKKPFTPSGVENGIPTYQFESKAKPSSKKDSKAKQLAKSLIESSLPGWPTTRSNLDLIASSIESVARMQNTDLDTASETLDTFIAADTVCHHEKIDRFYFEQAKFMQGRNLANLKEAVHMPEESKSGPITDEEIPF